MYKEIFKLVVAIISQPGKAWDILTRKEEKDDEFLSRFVYPLIGFVTVAAFLGVLFTRKEFDVELALKSSIRTLVAAFGGFYLASYLLNEIWQGWFKREKDMKLCQRFVGYSSSLMFALNIVLMLLPEFFFLRIFVYIYILYRMGRGRPLYAGGGEDTPEVCRDRDRSDFADALVDRGNSFHADARFTFLIGE